MVLVVIDPGHGGSDPGAVGNGLTEKDVALQISLYQRGRLRELGVSVDMTRETDAKLLPADRANIVRKSGARYCLSNHLNAGGGQGVEAVHSIYADGRLANTVIDAIAAAGQPRRLTPVYFKTLPLPPRRDFYYMHRETGATEVLLIEYGFIDHPEDAARLKANWKAYAEAAIRGFCLHAKLPYQAPRAPAADPREAAIYALQEAGVINSPDYWLINAKRGQTVNGEYAAGLIANMASFISKERR